jgi:hypothetical protein
LDDQSRTTSTDSGSLGHLQAGLGVINADLSNPKIDGVLEIRSVTLSKARPKTPVATVTHLGSIGPYTSNWVRDRQVAQAALTAPRSRRTTMPLPRPPLPEQSNPPGPLPSFSGQNSFELVDDDHDGYAEFLHVEIGQTTNRTDCTLSASLISPEGASILSLEMIPLPSGAGYSAYIGGTEFQYNKPGVYKIERPRLVCNGQLIPSPDNASIATPRLVGAGFRRPFRIALSAPSFSGPHHAEYWIDCAASAPLRFPLTASLNSPSFPDLQVSVQPTEAPCTEHAFKIAVDASPTLQPGNYHQVLHVHAPGSGSWSGEEARFDWKVNAAPEVVGVHPSRGIGSGALFHVAVQDVNSDIAQVDLLFNDQLREQGGCYVSYFEQVPSLNGDRREIVLHSDDGAVHAAAFANHAGVNNEHCSVAGGWDQLLRDVFVAFNPSFRGEKNVYVRAVDQEGANSDWKQSGTWLVTGAPPEAVAAIPYLGSGARQRFTFVLSNVNGNKDIEKAEVLIQFARTNVGACALQMDRTAGVVRLLDDAGAGVAGTLRFNAPGASIQNRQCAVSNVALIPDSNDSVRLIATVAFAPSFTGRRNIYARVEDRDGQASPLTWLGSWLVPLQ